MIGAWRAHRNSSLLEDRVRVDPTRIQNPTLLFIDNTHIDVTGSIILITVMIPTAVILPDEPRRVSDASATILLSRLVKILLNLLVWNLNSNPSGSCLHRNVDLFMMFKALHSIWIPTVLIWKLKVIYSNSIFSIFKI